MDISAIGQTTPAPQGADSTQAATTAQEPAKAGQRIHHHKRHHGGAGVPPAGNQPTDTAQISGKAKELAAQLPTGKTSEETNEPASEKKAEQSAG